jgi:uncharacterized protein YneF (UPF0154 family)
MFFNGFTLLLMILSLVAGIAFGMNIERTYQRSQRENWLNGESIEEQMERDGWVL